MKEQFVDYNTAFELKGKGFNDECFGYYNKLPNEKTFTLFGLNTKGQGSYSNDSLWGKKDYACAAPISSQVVDWFRVKHNIDIIILNKYERPNVGYYAEIKYARKDTLNKDNYYQVTLKEYPEYDRGVFEPGTYREAMKKAIEEALKLV